jgi:two-component system, chemotaxis family, chemotaxis protein CheY
MTQPPARVLVVDDNEALRENLAEALTLEGYDPTVAADGSAALRLLSEAEFDVVLLDLAMPGIDGRAVLGQIRADPRLTGLPVIITTGHSGPRAKAGVPADAFLLKPFGVRELLAALRSVRTRRVAPQDTGTG